MYTEIKFQCEIFCSSVCCGGATILTANEIGRLFKFFPITAGFRKIHPVSSSHKVYLQDFAIVYGGFYIIGDFIAGNRLKRRCRMLKESLCSIHGELKPLQCRIIPFSVTFPEDFQALVIAEKRKGAFRACKGFKEKAPLVWNGQLIEPELKENFYKLRENLIFQRNMMEKIFFSFKNTPQFKKFINAEEGLFEVPLLPEVIDEICEITGIQNRTEFLKVQKTLFINELVAGGIKNSLFIDALNAIERFKI
uniref:YkgJ family cysteine cluster protein n=1 Tax=Thermodesulfovibrio aggregans TaxID=86166 RepID=A0A7C4AII7_9BACT